MYKFNFKTDTLMQTTGGYSDFGVPIRDSYVEIRGGFGGRMHCVYYEPVAPTEKSSIGIVVIHSDGDYSTFNIAPELAKRGYRTLGGQVSNEKSNLEEKFLDIKHAVQFLKSIDGVRKIVLMGHSGGATLMSGYQAAAENGVSFLKRDCLLYKAELREELIPADAMLILDSNWGNGSMTLFSVDPAVIDDGCGVKLDPELDVFNPKNGFDPAGSHYSDAFIRKFYAAQRERNNAIVKKALDRLTLIRQGKGLYTDDEPFVIAGTAQLKPMNKIFPEDLRFLSTTKKPRTLLHKDGSETVELVKSLRRPDGGHQPTPSIRAAEFCTVRSYLSNRGVLAGEDYTVKADGAYGILWDEVFCCTPGNIKHITAPMLISGMTHGYEYLAAEEIYENSASRDKTLAFIEGADHNFGTPEPEKYGDTQKVLFDRCDQWLSAAGRLL